jgi:hypothetical protein
MRSNDDTYLLEGGTSLRITLVALIEGLGRFFVVLDDIEQLAEGLGESTGEAVQTHIGSP